MYRDVARICHHFMIGRCPSSRTSLGPLINLEGEVALYQLCSPIILKISFVPKVGPHQL